MEMDPITYIIRSTGVRYGLFPGAVRSPINARCHLDMTAVAWIHGVTLPEDENISNVARHDHDVGYIVMYRITEKKCVRDPQSDGVRNFEIQSLRHHDTAAGSYRLSARL